MPSLVLICWRPQTSWCEMKPRVVRRLFGEAGVAKEVRCKLGKSCLRRLLYTRVQQGGSKH
eukprot:12560642-Prorocentrum_lima.AAC.1